MSKFIDLTGQKFGRLTVIERADNRGDYRTYWKCECDCGKIHFVSSGNLKTGAVKSCGCARKEPPNKTHGKSNTKLYRKWQSMRRRCRDSNDSHYKNYGGRGIKVCEEWDNSFEAFAKWASETMVDENLTIERIDVNGDYCPENCTWVDKKAQANNRRYCLMFEHNGKRQNLMQWCEELGLDYKLVHGRLYKGNWSFEDAISVPALSRSEAAKWKNGG